MFGLHPLIGVAFVAWSIWIMFWVKRPGYVLIVVGVMIVIQSVRYLYNRTWGDRPDAQKQAVKSTGLRLLKTALNIIGTTIAVIAYLLSSGVTY